MEGRDREEKADDMAQASARQEATRATEAHQMKEIGSETSEVEQVRGAEPEVTETSTSVCRIRLPPWAKVSLWLVLKINATNVFCFL